MKKGNNYLFIALTIIAWLIFVGLSIEAGGLIVNFVFALYNPEFIGNLYNKLDLMDVYEQSQFAFYTVYSFIIFIAVLKAVLFYIVVMLVTKIDLKKPFNSFVSRQISLISYFTFSIGLLSYIGQESVRGIEKSGIDVANLDAFWSDSEAFILMSAIIYVIATIFKRGIELQNENDLTI